MEKLRGDRVLLLAFPEPKAEVSCIGKQTRTGSPENWALLGAGATAVSKGLLCFSFSASGNLEFHGKEKPVCGLILGIIKTSGCPYLKVLTVKTLLVFSIPDGIQGLEHAQQALTHY